MQAVRMPSAVTRYSGSQRLAFALLVIGSFACFATSLTPYWRHGQISIGNIASLFESSLSSIDKIADIKLVEFHGGFVYYCVKIPLKDMECKIYDFNNGKEIAKVLLVLWQAQFFLSTGCVLAACCRMCCCSGGRTVCHGITAFIAGASGLGVIGIFNTASPNSWAVELVTPDMDWAMYVYAAGAVAITLSSFMLCFASPDGGFTTGMIMSMPYSRMAEPSVRMETNMNQVLSQPTSGPPAYSAQTPAYGQATGYAPAASQDNNPYKAGY